MKETSKTIVFVAAALAMTGLAFVTWRANRPQLLSDFGSIGQPFFEGFESNKQATSLEVIAVDDKGARRRFQVRKQGNLWTIPSHFDYPAEAADRLTQTASAVIGLRREALAGRNATEHERFGVVDPNSPGAADPESVGKRLVLKDGASNTLADFILGKEAATAESDEERAAFERDRTEKYYYVRRTDENLTYKVRLDLNLSTKFADWIDPLLLQIEANRLVKLGIDDYQLKEEAADAFGAVKTLSKVPGKPSTLTRKAGFDPWTLEGLEADKFELNATKANEVVSTLEELKIVGVRPKFKWKGEQLITPNLELVMPAGLQNGTPEFEQFQEAVLTLQDELSSRGFQFAKKGEQLALVSDAGEFVAGTDDGVSYTLHFGKPVEGDEQAIEIGSGNQPSAQNESGKPAESGQENSQEPKSEAKPEATPDANGKNRYVMIRVAVDPLLLGERPVAPVEPAKPEQPAGYVPRPEAKPPMEGEQAAAVAEAGDDRDPKFIEYDAQVKAWEEAKKDYEMQKTQVEMQTKELDERVKAAEKRVAELNDRFGSWYYVVSAENLAGLLVKRTDLEQAKPKPEGSLPERPNIEFNEADVPPAPPVLETPDAGGGKAVPSEEQPAAGKDGSQSSESSPNGGPPAPTSADSLTPTPEPAGERATGGTEEQGKDGEDKNVEGKDGKDNDGEARKSPVLNYTAPRRLLAGR